MKKQGKGQSVGLIRGLRRSRAVGGNWLNCGLTAKEMLSNEVSNRSSVSGAPAILANVQSDSSAVCRGTLGTLTSPPPAPYILRHPGLCLYPKWGWGPGGGGKI